MVGGYDVYTATNGLYLLHGGYDVYTATNGLYLLHGGYDVYTATKRPQEPTGSEERSTQSWFLL
jgi:hypothetical protein